MEQRPSKIVIVVLFTGAVVMIATVLTISGVMAVGSHIFGRDRTA